MCVNLPTNYFLRTLMAINFYLEKRTDKKGESPIRVSIMIKGCRIVTSTGMKISAGKWNEEKQRAKKGAYTESGMTWSDLNRIQDKITEHFNGIENDALTNDIEITPEFLKSEFNCFFRHKSKKAPAPGIEEEEGPVMTFPDYYHQFTKERGESNQWTRATHQKFNTFERHLQDWVKDRKRELSFDLFTEEGLNDLIKFFRENLDLKNSTIGKQLGLLKWFLRWATLKGYNKNVAFQSFSPKLKTAQKEVVFLDWAELMKVFNYSVPKTGTIVTLRKKDGSEYEKTVHFTESMKKTRDIFCFCCFTSLRYSDAQNLKWSNVKNDKITITTIKTNDTITIELNKYALSILERYKGEDHGGYVFPRITNQRMNLYVKELAELCEINQPVTRIHYRGMERIEETFPKFELIGTHTGRRTFICNALELGIPTEIVMKWTGHSDYKSMKPYIDVTSKAKEKAMKLFDNL